MFPKDIVVHQKVDAHNQQGVEFLQDINTTERRKRKQQPDGPQRERERERELASDHKPRSVLAASSSTKKKKNTNNQQPNTKQQTERDQKSDHQLTCDLPWQKKQPISCQEGPKSVLWSR